MKWICWIIADVAGDSSFTVFMTDYATYAGIFTCQKLAFSHRRSATILSRTRDLDKIFIDKVSELALVSFGAVHNILFTSTSHQYCNFPDPQSSDLIQCGSIRLEHCQPDRLSERCKWWLQHSHWSTNIFGRQHSTSCTKCWLEARRRCRVDHWGIKEGWRRCQDCSFLNQ